LQDAAPGADQDADGADEEEAMQAARREAEALLAGEEAAARTIQAWWRARSKKRAAAEQGGATHARDHAFDAVFEEAKEYVASWRAGREGEKALQAMR
jgi:hypothetical protein